MRPVTKNVYQHTGNPVREIKMRIDLSNSPQLMNMLTSMYSNPLLAVIREYSTNARDAHVEAGNTEPIQITLPSIFSPTFVCADNGVGMSPQDIEDIYSSYGQSTKRETDDQTGMLGIGGKSGLTIADQFTIEAVKNGVKTIAVMTRGDNGAGVIKIMDTSATTDPNGVRISIPVDPLKVDSFNDEASNFFSWWPTNTVLVDGEDVSVMDDPDWGSYDGFRIMVYDRGTPATSGVIMGNIFYPVSQSNMDLPYGYNAVVEVPMGAVEFAPSREQLMFTDHTNATLSKVRGVAAKWVRDKYDYDNMTDPQRFVNRQVINDWGLSTAVIPYNESLPNVMKRSGDKLQRDGFFSPFDLRGEDRTNKKVLRVVNCDVNVTRRHAEKAWLYADSKSLEIAGVCITDVDSDWIEFIDVDYSIIKAFRLPRTKASSSDNTFEVITSSTRYYDAKGDKIAGTDLPDEFVIVPVGFVRGSDMPLHMRQDRMRDLINLVRETDTTFVLIPKNKMEKFMRENDDLTIHDLSDFIKEALKKWYDTLSDEDKLNLSSYELPYRFNDDFKGLSDDIDLVASAVEYNKKGRYTAHSTENVFRAFRGVSRESGVRVDEIVSDPEIVGRLRENFPLLEYLWDAPSELVVAYIKENNNAV